LNQEIPIFTPTGMGDNHQTWEGKSMKIKNQNKTLSKK